ncbi:Lsr2 protein [Haloactinopolyspora alba]|uniref:Lsr2 protein n=1 Tax=Haloactinopolyspora alba TaxID=648780 RepID=A0A2P8DHI8_9ACTN|nr:Lsr2 family protein [Haloactinopolyspora alba]PSK96680.1 Lsr2 protein [Haloactinopolyspora alba]
MAIAIAAKITILKMLASGRDAEFVASAVPDAGLTASGVEHLGAEHGYPDRDKLAWAVDILEKQKLREARAEVPPAKASAPARRVHAAETTGFQNTASDVNHDRLDSSRREPAPPAVDELIAQARESGKARTRNLGARIEGLVDDLRRRLDSEEEEARQAAEREAERTAALEEVRRLEEQLEAARKKARKFKNAPGGNGRAAVTRSPSAESRTPGGKAAQAALDYNAAEVRAWARENGIECPTRGRFLPRGVVDAWREATAS